MGKSTHFFGQSVFGQLIRLIDPSIVRLPVLKTMSDRYVKRFKTWDHLVSMLFVSFSGCTSLREVSGALLGMKGKVSHFQLSHLPYRSTLSDANKRRPADVFGMIYYGLLKKYEGLLSDSQAKGFKLANLHIIDSTSIGLFKDFLKCVGRKNALGRQKGGIKVHTMINANEPIPQLIHFTDASHHDQRFYSNIKFISGHIYVFDKGYNNYDMFKAFNENEVNYVTRLKDNAAYELLIDLDIPHKDSAAVLKDQIVELPIRKNGQIVDSVTARIVTFYDKITDKTYVFLTNMDEVDAKNIADIYKQRWQIESLFKQLKQNFPLKYFLGDNENAVIIQIWSALICNLLLTVVRNSITKKWSFSNLCSFVRVNLINYLDLFSFLDDPEKDWISTDENNQTSFDFSSA
jgi:hypothetical protein